MKAWNDLIESPDINVWTTENSEWYLDKGVKIERFHNGIIEVKNVMGSGHNFADVTKMQRWYFDNVGWFAGCYKVQSDEFESVVNSLTDKIRYGLNPNAEVTAKKKRDEYMHRKFLCDQALEREIKSLPSPAAIETENLK